MAGPVMTTDIAALIAEARTPKSWTLDELLDFTTRVVAALEAAQQAPEGDDVKALIAEARAVVEYGRTNYSPRLIIDRLATALEAAYTSALKAKRGSDE